MQNKEAWLMPGFFCVKKNAIQKDGVLGKLEAKSALGELGSAAGGLQTVLLKVANRKALWRRGFREQK